MYIALAFNKVYHKDLVYEAKKIYPGEMHRILESFLAQCRFRVKYKTHKS